MIPEILQRRRIPPESGWPLTVYLEHVLLYHHYHVDHQYLTISTLPFSQRQVSYSHRVLKTDPLKEYLNEKYIPSFFISASFSL